MDSLESKETADRPSPFKDLLANKSLNQDESQVRYPSIVEVLQCYIEFPIECSSYTSILFRLNNIAPGKLRDTFRLTSESQKSFNVCHKTRK